MKLEQANGNIKVLEKALTVLDAVKDAAQPTGVNEIAKICGLSAATTFRILKTFKNRGWVYQDENEKYTVGHKISFVTERNNFYTALKEIAYYTMSALTAKESQAMNLVVREEDKCRIIQQSRTMKIVDYTPPVGTILPFHASACGKVLLAYAPKIIRNEILDSLDYKKMTTSTITSRERLVEELGKITSQGFSVDAHESQDEGFCIAVPVFGNDGGVIAALSFSGFIGQRDVKEVDRYVGILKSASEEITKKLFRLTDDVQSGDIQSEE